MEAARGNNLQEHSGTLQIYLAFDWGDEILLERVRPLLPVADLALPRRPRTPASFSWRPAPLQHPLGTVPLAIAELPPGTAEAVLTLYDFGAVSLSLRRTWSLPRASLLRLAAGLAAPEALLRQAQALLRPLFEKLRPAITAPDWREDLSEEYFVFLFDADGPAQAADLDEALLAGLVHLEAGSLSSEEVAEALKLKLSYGRDDLFLPDWAAAVLVDRDCEETLQVLELANVQLLEYRHIDDRLDARLAEAARTIGRLKGRAFLPIWRSHVRPLHALGELKVEAAGLFERTGNVLKLVGDPYLARVHRLLARRFHLEEWERNIQRKLDTAEGIHQVVSDQASHLRSEFLEMAIIFLILFEIVMAFIR